jgi:para-nitrobenzyl esterase
MVTLCHLMRVTTDSVETASGRVTGVDEDGVRVFRGIPFAGAPTATHRFRPPRPVEPWKGVRTAGEYGDWAPQNPPPGLFSSVPSGPQSENCLTLNVWTPGFGGAARPVLLWIHGGAFLFGSGASPLYEGKALAARGDVVVVTVNYRLGILGYLAHPELGGGNWGLLDQIAALKWVRENIASFGGNPGNVTAFGESAGGMSVGDLLTAPAARGLFHKAIIQSGPPYATSMKGAIDSADNVLRQAGVGGVAGLRDVAVADLLRIQEAVVARRRADLPFIPVVDLATLPELPATSITAGSSASVPLLIGTNREEATVFLASDPDSRDPDEATLRTKIERSFSLNAVKREAAEVIELYRRARRARGDPASPRDIWVAIETDRMFRIGSIETAEHQSHHHKKTFCYQFTWSSPAFGGAIAAGHAVELPFVFGTLSAPRMDTFAGSGPEAETLSRRMMDAWIAFARKSDPSTSALGRWPPYESDQRATMLLGAEPKVENAPQDDERRIWTGA